MNLICTLAERSPRGSLPCFPLWELAPPCYPTRAVAQSSAAQDAGGIRKLNAKVNRAAKKTSSCRWLSTTV